MDKIKRLPADIKQTWKINAVIDFAIWLVIVSAIFIGRIFVPTGMKKIFLIVGIIIAIVNLVWLIAELLLINYHWNYWTYFVDGRQVELHHGYFFRKQIVIPIARVQNVTLKQGPILRLKDLQKVIVETAAGASEIDGLKTSEANEIKELIMELAREAKNDL
ncbi:MULTISPECIES: PH domain-containing protein [unclassified Companilactobacillus]|uniref:PH domain-containing protein n=1 Tax=unclassified Companilactobacillus TaxID=2767904 RepID=UPI002FEEC38B